MNTLQVQFTGMGTALKILFSDQDTPSNQQDAQALPFQLTRGEVVALFNAFGR